MRTELLGARSDGTVRRSNGYLSPQMRRNS
jgi:hypothetical protein